MDELDSLTRNIHMLQSSCNATAGADDRNKYESVIQKLLKRAEKIADDLNGDK